MFNLLHSCTTQELLTSVIKVATMKIMGGAVHPAQEKRLPLRYKKPLLCLPHCCDGCGAPFSIEHILDCWISSLVGRRHNEVRDAFGDLASLLWNPVVKEPVWFWWYFELLVADLCVCGVWQPQTKELFDIRVVDIDAWVAPPLLCCVVLRLRRNTSIH